MRNLPKELLQLPNIGKVLAARLQQAGIDNTKQLVQTGSKRAFLMIMAFDPEAYVNILYALEGAIHGMDSKLLSIEKKAELKLFAHQLDYRVSA